MHPLFVAHLIADFLLQPTALVLWKQKEITGVITHASIHAIVMLLLFYPDRPSLMALILLIAVLHGAIDLLKINYQKKNKGFTKGFILDQLAHFAVLAVASYFMPFTYSAWQTEAFKGTLLLLAYFSLALAAFHLTHAPLFTFKKTSHRVGRLLLIVAIFGVYLGASKAFATSCGA